MSIAAPDDRIEVVHDGQVYHFTDEKGLVAKNHLIPPEAVRAVVLPKLDPVLEERDACVHDVEKLRDLAIRSRDQGMYRRAERCARKALQINPRRDDVAATLCSALRLQRRAMEALEVAMAFPGTSNVALLTSRAAAMVDEGHAAEARAVCNKAWAIATKGRLPREEISAVYRRIERETR